MVEQATALRVRCEKNNTSFARFTFFLYFYMLFEKKVKSKAPFFVTIRSSSVVGMEQNLGRIATA